MFKLPENPYPDKSYHDMIYQDMYSHAAYREGGEAYTKALIGWLFEPCTEHLITAHADFTDTEPSPDYQRLILSKYQDHRYLCLECMRELREWSGNI
jgi:hypothetical protein